MGPLEQNDYRAYRTLSVLAILVFITLASLFFHYLEYQILAGMKARSGFPRLLMDFRQGVMGNLQLLFMLGAMVFFVKWFQAAYRNLHKVDSGSLCFRPKWALGCWFMPVYNLYHPYQIMVEIWEKTQAFAYPSETEKPSLVRFWWSLMVINVVAKVVSWRMEFQAETVAELMNASQLNLFCDIVTLLGLFVTFSLIHKVLNFEKELWVSRRNLIGA